MAVYPHRGLTFTRGEGVHLVTASGERYLDMMSNYGVNILGYNHPRLNAALVTQFQALPTLHGSFASPGRTEAAERLTRRVFSRPASVYWANSGAEAIEAALKFAAVVTGKKRFLACRNGYHGKTLGALSATHDNKYRRPFEPLLWRFEHVDFGDSAQLEAVIDDATAAFVVEPVQGEGGLHVPRRGYLEQVREICTRRGVLLITDEVQTGTGRTGTFLAAQHEGVEADIVCLGKGLGGGIPIGAAVAREDVASRIPRSTHTSTFGGNPLACAGVNAVLEILDDDLLRRVTELGARFVENLTRIRHDLVVEVRGCGLMIGVAVRDRRDDILKALQRERILAIPSGDAVVRFLPPYLVERADLDRVAQTLDSVLRTL